MQIVRNSSAECVMWYLTMLEKVCVTLIFNQLLPSESSWHGTKGVLVYAATASISHVPLLLLHPGMHVGL